MSATQYCTFFVDDLFFGVDVLKVQEVILYQPMSRAPLAPPAVRGLINLRGQIVTAIDMRCHLALRPFALEAAPMNVVVRNEGETVSLLVDRIGDVLTVDEASFESPPDTVRGITREIITGIHKLDRLLLVMDTEKTINLLGHGASGQNEAA